MLGFSKDGSTECQVHRVVIFITAICTMCVKSCRFNLEIELSIFDVFSEIELFEVILFEVVDSGIIK